MGYSLLGNFKNLPQVSLNGRSRVSQKDPDSPFENVGNTITYTPKPLLNCSVQPLTGKALKDYENLIGPEGFKNVEAYYIYTSTKLVVGVEGTGILSDQVELESVTGLNLWFTVLRAFVHNYTGVQRYKYLVILDTTQI